MAKKKRSGKSQDLNLNDFELVDIFYIPKTMAGMYRALRQAVKEEVEIWLDQKFGSYQLEEGNQEEGQALVALDESGQEVFRFYLNPNNISQAQVARDKEHLEDYLLQFVQE